METFLYTVGIVVGAWSFFNLGRLWETIGRCREINDQKDRGI